VRETARAAAERAEAAAAIRAENDALAEEFVRLKQAGLITDLLPIDAIATTALTRDRAPGPDPELGELMASIRAIGLSNPIRVAEAGAGRYELVEGWRRLAAFRRLHQETGEDRWARIPAARLPAGIGLTDLYRRMVDENLVRRDISFAEMARLAQRFAADPQSGVEDMDAAVRLLYGSAGYQKRSYIRAFGELLDMLDKELRYPEAIPRNLGLALRKRLETGPGVLGALQRALRDLGERTAEEELAVLRRFADPDGRVGDGAPKPAGRGGAVPRPAKTSFRIDTAAGEARCAASPGRLEIRMRRDFSELERRRLEAAVAAFFQVLDG